MYSRKVAGNLVVNVFIVVARSSVRLPTARSVLQGDILCEVTSFCSTGKWNLTCNSVSR